MANLDDRIVSCRLCPRLVAWRELVAREKRAQFQNELYWGRPVPNFGDPDADRLIVGLAPAAHGGNRTGRMFTGDRSGDWLYGALYRAGVANQPTSTRRDDGLCLKGVLVTAVAHCAPPANKPTAEELRLCSCYYVELLASRPWRSILCLGSIAWEHTHRQLGARTPKFAHGTESRVGSVLVVSSYHPSQQNTFTGKLTESMLDKAVRRFLDGV